jgi:C-terminal processing protease CtpA/Prc
MTRLPGENFGFTITWMQPPKIEDVKPESPAEICGLLPGDHIVFVGNHNVVTMNELDILDLIVKQGDNLIFEVFRPTSAKNSFCPIEELALLSTPISVKDFSKSIIREDSNEKCNGFIDLDQTICETPKKRANLPKIAFNENIGNGVLV